MRLRSLLSPGLVAVAATATLNLIAQRTARAQDSPTTIHTGPVTWGEGGSASFLVDKVDGTQGINWSLDDVTGTLNFSSSTNATDTFTIDISSVLYGGDGKDTGAVGPATDWNPSEDYTWTFVHTTDGVLNYDPAKVTLDSSSFVANNNLDGGQFVLQLLNGGNDVAIHFVSAGELPEPTSLGLLALALLPIGVALRRSECSAARFV